MLEQLDIRNIALIEELHVTFENGLTILSGETGAGKSIIIDSLEFVLGKRADKSLIRYGQNEASVSAFFDISACRSVRAMLDEAGLADDDQLMLRRVMSADGKNACYINGNKVTLHMLRTLTASLVHVYGQHEGTTLLDDTTHLSVLDNYGHERLQALLTEHAELYHQYHQVLDRIREYGSLSQVNRDLDSIRHEIDEITQAELKEGEEDALIAQRKIYLNAQNLLESYANAQACIAAEDDDNVLVRLAQAIALMRQAAHYDADAEDLIARTDSVKIELQDIAQTLSDKAESMDFDPREMQACEERLATIRSLKRKYGNSEKEILRYLEQLQERYDMLSDGEAALEKLEKEKTRLGNALYAATCKLSQRRSEIAAELSERIVSQLRELGMKDAQFCMPIAQVPPQDQAMSQIRADGIDSPVFLFSANAGQPPRELSKIISGGELSRFLLAVKSILADTDGITTMVFDEIDTGISGKIAQVVAEKMAAIACGKQVLAVTHLPQLAAMADVHMLIEKYVTDGQTHTRLRRLDEQGEIEEISRLGGGSSESAYAGLHAQEMKQNATRIKAQLRK